MTITLPELDNIVRTFYTEKDANLVRTPTASLRDEASHTC